MNKQLHFIENKDIGFEKENIVYFELENKKGDLFFDKLSNYPEIKSFCLTDGLTENTLSRNSGDLVYNGEKNLVKYMRIRSDYRYISTMGMTITSYNFV